MESSVAKPPLEFLAFSRTLGADMGTKERVLVAMSGGVDSSVAMGLLHEQGYDLVGVTLHLWDAEGEDKVGRCCAPEDRQDARRVCDQLGVPHYVLDERSAFREHVVNPFVHAYAEGVTPSPCISCNQHVKLSRLVELADAWGASHIATGHYARLERDAEGNAHLLRGVDLQKDQSYFLFGVPQNVLCRMMFPLGNMVKSEVRNEGRRMGLINADKPDSQQLCFVPDGKIGEFVGKRTEQTSPGVFRDEQGKVVGSHQGVHQFTVGQRRGLGLQGDKAQYVLRILPETQDVIVGSEASLLSNRLRATQATWVRGRVGEPFFAHVRIRYRHEPAAARIVPTSEGFDVEFETPQRAITPGQAAVVYCGDEVTAGGTIAA